ncbi:RIP metalloprotease RseP [Patescibacteria group bacterium]|nr:RIP metalloprotease RseP [Patescibacteria group bacterium]
MTVIIFIIALAILVFVHELGHFLAAKISGIRVDEFGLGFPPKIFGFKRGETTYTLNAIPFGGFVKIFGEDPNEESIGGPDSARSFVNKPKSLQAMVLVAGVTFNVIFAWILISLGFMIGMPVPQGYVASTQLENTAVTITAVSPNSPADNAGLKAGDKVLRLESGTDVKDNPKPEDISPFINTHKDQEVSVTYERAGIQDSIAVVPKEGIVANSVAIGISIDELGILKLPIHKALWEGGKLTGSVIKATAVGLGQFIYQAVTGNAKLADVTGPVGIAGLVGDARQLGAVYLLSFIAFISVNLAVINLLPFPALDGGRLLFVLIEKIKGSAINPKIANTINGVGFALLLLLMVVVTLQDVIKLFR